MGVSSSGALSEQYLAPTDIHNWYALFTLPRHERKVCENLINIGINAFLPTRKEIHQWTDRKKLVTVPLFPCYVFLSLAITNRLVALKIKGVVRYIDSNSRPTRITNREIDLIRNITLVGDSMAVDENQFRQGDKVIVTQGPLKGEVGCLVALKGTARVIFELQNLKKGVLVDIPSGHIEKLKEPVVVQ